MSDKSATAATSNASTSASTTVSTTTGAAAAPNYRLPSDVTLQHASKLAIVEDKPIMLDYWTASVDKKALVGVRESGEKLLVKSAEEYTSPIAKFYKSATEYIIITENSIYIVSSDIPTRKIS
jgi:hypothetical protein